MSDYLSQGKPTDNPLVEYHSLEYALFITCFINVFGGLSFLLTAWYVVSDREKADLVIKGAYVTYFERL